MGTSQSVSEPSTELLIVDRAGCVILSSDRGYCVNRAIYVSRNAERVGAILLTLLPLMTFLETLT
jgi:hypothetical protein